VKLFSAFLNWRVPAQWYALAFTWKFIATFAGIGTLALLGIRQWPGAFVSGFLPDLLRNMPFIVGIAIVEETSWMKFAVTRMNERYSALRAAMVIGICWGMWYLPMLLLGEGVPDGIPWPVFLLSMFSLTVLLIMQVLSNCAFIMVPVLPGWHELDPSYVISFVCAFFIGALAIVWYAGPKQLNSKGLRATWSGKAPA
jgi:hypothetical protein